jgi:hypothetical protein
MKWPERVVYSHIDASVISGSGPRAAPTSHPDVSRSNGKTAKLQVDSAGWLSRVLMAGGSEFWSIRL